MLRYIVWSWKTDFEWLTCPNFLLGTCKYLTSILQWGFQKIMIILHVRSEVHQQTQLSEGRPFWGISLKDAALGTQMWTLQVLFEIICSLTASCCWIGWAHLSAKVLHSSLLLHWCLLCCNGSGNSYSPSVNLVKGESEEVSRTTVFNSSYSLALTFTSGMPTLLSRAAHRYIVLLCSRDQKPPETQTRKQQAQRSRGPPPNHHLPLPTTRKCNKHSINFLDTNPSHCSAAPS